MEHLRWIGFGAFFASSLVIGTRLLLLARRTGQIPELLIGIAVIGIGPLGYGLSILAFATSGYATILSATLRGSGFLAVFIGAAAQYLFVWYVFRRQARWSRSAVHLAIALLALSYVGDILENGLVNRTAGGGWFWIGMSLRLLVMAWSSLESLAYWGRMRRRLRLGLADPVVTNRFFLWGAGSGAAFLGSALLVVVMIFSGFSAREIPIVNLIVSLHGLVAAVAMWLAFQPPASYLRFVEARSRRCAGAIPSSSA
jgi:hypothetical protein